MSTSLLPQSFWFRVAIPCRRVDEIPRPKGRLLDLPETCALPDFAPLDDRTAWASLRVAWNPSGLAVAIEATGKVSEGFRIWVDTRDTRNVHRATRFCHQFEAQVRPGSSASALRVEIAQRPIHRAQADAPIGESDLIQIQGERSRRGWRVGLFLPAEALNGFDPETNRRLGFAYQVYDAGREDQFLGVGREFPVGEDPSLWATLELTETS